ncbi:MAG: HD domain-containing protein [Erysipelotrichaceae bacterium]|nr:HD domain-containing protein [Erysipelotrichaceae bacterium]
MENDSENKILKIKEFKEKISIEQPLLLGQVKDGVTNSGAPYLSVTLQDNSGTIEGKLWDVKEPQKNAAKAGQVVLVRGDVFNYRGALQVRITDLREIDQIGINLKDYLTTGSIDRETIVEEVRNALKRLKNPVLKKLLCELFADCKDTFFEYPAAAKNHHEFCGGLSTHVVGMLRVGYAVCELYPMLDEDLLISGILAHDLGKLIELSGAILPDYTTEGRLLGHISIMQAKIAEKASELGIPENDESVVLLRHMVLSHHGQYEYGSPVLPMIPEAEVLHMIDNMDARMEMMRKSLDDVEEGAFTQRIFSLENRMLYKHKKLG